MKRKTTKEFIEQAQIIHGNKYDYSKTEYKGCKTKICIICPEHGEFWQTPDNHVNSKQGCPKCANNIQLTVDEFINKAKQVHGDKYDYSKVIYTNYLTKVVITCPLHGDFEQLPLNHLKGAGCCICSKERTSNSKKVNLQESLNKASNTHNNFYNYSKVKFNKTSDKVTIICPIHGEFIQVWNNHLEGGGCPKCNKSKGEKIVARCLKSKNITYIEQYKINIPKDINKSGIAYVDFYLPDYNTFIEYNGEQHYTPKKQFGGMVNFKRQQKRDQYVRDYCQNNDIKLIEIKFNENIDNKLINL